MQVAEKSLAEVKLGTAAEVRAGSYSGGMKRRLSVAIALIGDPKLIFLDEPVSTCSDFPCDCHALTHAICSFVHQCLCHADNWHGPNQSKARLGHYRENKERTSYRSDNPLHGRSGYFERPHWNHGQRPIALHRYLSQVEV